MTEAKKVASLTPFKFALAAGIALLLHVFLGWGWSVGGALVAGAWSARRGWLAGGLALLVEWGLMVVFNYMVAPEEAGRMMGIMGAMMGNLPGAAFVAVTLLVAVLLGSAGGAVGSLLMRWRAERR